MRSIILPALSILLKLTLAAEPADHGIFAFNEGLIAIAPRPQQVNAGKNGTQAVKRAVSPLSTFGKRQTCNYGQGYCDENGYCCDLTDSCCPTTCCNAGEDCCWEGCIPDGADCCSDGGYCEVGNMCVISYDTGDVGCCTDLECTAVVTGGTTSYLSTDYYSYPATSYIMQTTPAPSPTDYTYYSTYTYGATNVYYDYYYWTITWWYYSFYWYNYAATSYVTYTPITTTTTYTVSATDVYDASSQFLIISSTLSEALTPPAEATSLAATLSAEVAAQSSYVLPSATPSAFSYDFGGFGASSSVVGGFGGFGGGNGGKTTRQLSASASPTGLAAGGGNGEGNGGGSAASSVRPVSWEVAFMAIGVVIPGLLMVWL